MVQNRGISSQAFNVVATDGGSYSSTKTVAVNSGKASIVSFDPWTPTSAGTVDFKVYTQLTGDQNNINDTLTVTLSKGVTDTVQWDAGYWDTDWADSCAVFAVKFNPERPCTLKSVQTYCAFRKVAAVTWACSLIVYQNVNGIPGPRMYAQQYAVAAWATPGWKNMVLTSPGIRLNGPAFIGLKTAS